MKEEFHYCEASVKLDEYSINYYYRKGLGEEAIVFLHGYPTSSLDYQNIWYLIPDKYSIVAHDHLGFGKSDKPLQYNYQLITQADYALKLYKVLGIKKVHLVAHDYGTSVATEIIARDNSSELKIDLLSVTLSNGSMLIDMARLRPIQHLLKNKITGPIVSRLTNSWVFHRNMKNLWFDKRLYDKDQMQEHWELLIAKNGRKVLPRITRYIDQRYAHYDKWIGALTNTHLPIHILWAENDLVAVVEMADRLKLITNSSTKTIIKNCGHFPMIEQPKNG